ncbi:MAG: hypothetical protein ACAF41_06785 [Leptolyngbya sp. BL-A-14]
MVAQRYQHCILRLNGTSQINGKYRLQIAEVTSSGQPVSRAQWHFQTLKGLLSFIERHFPASSHEDISRHLRFQVVQATDR